MSMAACSASANSRGQTWSRPPGHTHRLQQRTQYSVLCTRCFSASILLAALSLLAAPSTAQETQNDSFSARLSALAAKCDDLGLKEQAEITRRWIIERHPRRQYLFLPANMDATAPKSGAPEP